MQLSYQNNDEAQEMRGADSSGGGGGRNEMAHTAGFNSPLLVQGEISSNSSTLCFAPADILLLHLGTIQKMRL